MNQPIISVLMATYNTPIEWLGEAIDSILNQEFKDFELIIIDDCSEDDIENVKKKYDDSRIIWITNKQNLGLTKSLNKGLKVARGKYIARMDADDISTPDRFAQQVDFMEKHPEIIVCGSYRRAFGKENKDEIWNIPASKEEQQVQLFFFNCGLTHPTAMFRKAMLDEYGIEYNENYTKAQDYGIWVQCTRYAPMAVIPKILLNYRKSEQQISTMGRQSQLENDKRVKIDQLVSLGICASEKEKDMHVSFCRGEDWDSVNELEQWIERLRFANRNVKYFDETVFERILGEKWYSWCKKKYRIEGKEEVKEAYKRAVRFSYVLQDIEVKIKQILVSLLRRGAR